VQEQGFGLLVEVKPRRGGLTSGGRMRQGDSPFECGNSWLPAHPDSLRSELFSNVSVAPFRCFCANSLMKEALLEVDDQRITSIKFQGCGTQQTTEVSVGPKRWKDLRQGIGARLIRRGRLGGLPV
jgi:hypothetical protein